MPAEPPDKAGRRRSSAADGKDLPVALIEFAAARAHDLTDTVYARVKHGIDDARRSATDLHIATLLRHAQPLLVRAGRFVRAYPMRTGTIVALLVGALWLARTPKAHGG